MRPLVAISWGEVCIFRSLSLSGFVSLSVSLHVFLSLCLCLSITLHAFLYWCYFEQSLPGANQEAGISSTDISSMRLGVGGACLPSGIMTFGGQGGLYNRMPLFMATPESPVGLGRKEKTQ